ncbi:MAG TPA: tetratricopeptide repeat protein [Pseudolabrys sp.]|nr:tetratricopeptide repeat protein [Pseudolabrys sp.]
MTACLIGPRKVSAVARPRLGLRFRLRCRLGGGVAAMLVALQALTLVALSCASAIAADPVKGEVKVSTEGGYARLAFRFDQEVPATIRVTFPIMVVSFKQPVAIDISRLNADARDYISAARVDPDGTAIRIALVHPVKIDSIPAAERLFVDLMPENWVGVMPGLPREVIQELADRARTAEHQLHREQIASRSRKPSSIRVRVATQPTFVRYVFELPDLANAVPDRSGGTLALNFDQAIKWDLADVIAALPATLKSVASHADTDSAVVTFVLNGKPNVRTFREDRSVIVDVGLDGAKPRAAAAAPVTENAKTAPATAPAVAPASSAANVPAIEPPDTVPAGKDAANRPPLVPVPPADNRAAPPPAPAVTESKSKAEAPAVVAVPKVAAKPPAPAAARAAADKPPPPDPKAPVVVELHQTGDNLRAEFPFAVPTPAAVFRRADSLWLVFDTAAKIDLSALVGSNPLIRNAVQERGGEGEAVLRIKLARPRLVSLEADGPSWIVNIGDIVTVPSRPLAIARSIVGKNRASIAIPFSHPAKIHSLTDHDIGDRLMVVTALAPARGFLKEQNFVELRALPSTQGVVLQPIADDITAELAEDKITISRPGGLSLSATAIGQQQLATSFRAMTFDTQLWGFDRQAPFNARQDDLIRTAAMAPQIRRRQARLSLARFYLARDMSAEAKAVLDVTLQDERGTDDVTGSVLKAVANVLLDRPEDALKVLANPQIGNQLDAPIWRAIAFAQQGKWPEAHDAFKNVEAAMGALPIELQRLALRQALHAAIEVRDFAGADRMLNEFQTMGVPPAMEASIAVLAGRLDEGLGRNEDALKNYRTAVAGSDRRSAAQGRLREIMLSFAIGEMPRKDVIHDLETLTTVWRGDETEVEGLKLLAHLYTQDQRYRDAFHVMRVAMMSHPNSDLTRQIQDEAAVTFDSLFLAGKGDALPPIEALGLFYDFRELTPIGRRGDEMIRRLADRLVSVDLLDQAAELLQHQVDHRLQGAARAQVATRLAVIYLMNRKPDRALAALRSSRSDGLSNELRDQRLLLEARALSDTGRHDLALELIGNIEGHQATRLRADILWAAHRWRAAAEQIELLYGERWKNFKPLSDSERADILRAAIGYALGDEALGLSRFREKYAAKMADGPDRRAFEVVSAPTGTGGKEFQNVAKMVAGASTLDAFLGEMRARYPDSAALSSAATDKNKEKGKAPATAKPDAKPKPQAKAQPEKPAAASALPPNAPAGVPLKPDPAPTGSIPRLPK